MMAASEGRKERTGQDRKGKKRKRKGKEKEGRKEPEGTRRNGKEWEGTGRNDRNGKEGEGTGRNGKEREGTGRKRKEGRKDGRKEGRNRQAGKDGGREARRQTDRQQPNRQAGRKGGREGVAPVLKIETLAGRWGTTRCFGLMTPLWSFQGLQAKKTGANSACSVYRDNNFLTVAPFATWNLDRNRSW